MWLFAAASFALLAVYFLTNRTDFFKIMNFFGILMDILALTSADTLKREQIEPNKLAALLVIDALIIVFTYIVPDIILTSLFNAVAVCIVWGYYCHCSYLVYKRAPTAMKRYAQLWCVGTILPVFGMFSVFIDVQMYTFSISMSAAVVLMVYAYVHEPKLLFVLPFTALRLDILETKGGLSLFTHTWNRQSSTVSDDLFSGMLQGVSLIVKESLNRGDVQEIRVSDAIILAYRNPDFPIACVIVATRPTRSLRDALRLFAERFYKEFSDYFTNVSDVAQFSGAEALVTACFPHVPVYD
ncbi:MAG: hypothetical protein JW839_14185 [Candidatus Lokiarchaeota archaeon]|nr:hypothetical protein [Candidatus Lokiarchaeota archaeon]